MLKGTGTLASKSRLPTFTGARVHSSTTFRKITKGRQEGSSCSSFYNLKEKKGEKLRVMHAS